MCIQTKRYIVNVLYKCDLCMFISTGILCGDCSSDDEGFSALLNNCVSCHNGYSVLIPLLGTEMIHTVLTIYLLWSIQ